MESIINIDQFGLVEMRVGKIKRVDTHPNAEKLYVMQVDLGEIVDRTIVAGLRRYYSPEQLVGLKAIFVTNLEPVNLRGVKSDGMILAAVNDDETEVVVIVPENQEIEEGSRIR